MNEGRPNALARRRALLDFDDHPLVAIWETTQACELVCAHCRACATPDRHPHELSTEEGKRLLSKIHEMGTPLCILTGGDPALRNDLVELVTFGHDVGLTMAMTPSGTGRMKRELLERLGRAGLKRVAVSVDGPDGESHDMFRGVLGSYAHSMRILREARELGLETQMNFTLSRVSFGRVREMAALAHSVGVTMFVLFLVVPTGRASEALGLSAHEVESALNELADVADEYPFQVKTTAAPQFRRILLERHHARSPVGLLRDFRDGTVTGPRGINDGSGFLFVSHTGDVMPSGFFPVSAGNIRAEDLALIYRESELFKGLRESSRLGGKCGDCPFRTVCGGSRARALAVFGDAWAEDPGCSYVPRVRKTS